MRTVGRVASVWRYPVKSMRGEQLEQAFVGFAGVYGDRCYAFLDSAAPKKFPYFTGREKESMLLYQPQYRYPEHMAAPPNLAEAEAGPTGLTPVYPDTDHLAVDVKTPSGDTLSVDDPKLVAMLRQGLPDRHELRLHRSHRSMTDCRPVSLFSLRTVEQFSQEVGTNLDRRCFRSNVYMELDSTPGFGENEFVGRTLQIGKKAVVAVTNRDARCKMITLDPNSAQANPEIMRSLARNHNGEAGIYGAVLVEGLIRPGDDIAVHE